MTKTALITGAAKRIGKAISLHLAAQGWNIALHFNSSENEALLLHDELKTTYPDQYFELFRADLNNSFEVEALIPQVLKDMNNIDQVKYI